MVTVSEIRNIEAEPDQHFLDMIGMTKEEYLQKDLELKAAAEAEDAALITVEEVEEEPEDGEI